MARDHECREQIEKKDRDHVLKHCNKTQVVFDIAESASDFEAKVDTSDVLYFAGGTYLKLWNEAKKITNIQKHIQDKVVIGSSAGAFLICTYSLNSFDYQINDINEVFGLLPLNVLCHWDIEDKKQEKITKIKSTWSKPSHPKPSMKGKVLASLVKNCLNQKYCHQNPHQSHPKARVQNLAQKQ